VPAHLPAMSPGPTFTGMAVSGAVLLGAAQHEPEKAMDRYRQFIGYGVDIANGGTGKPRPPGDAAAPPPAGAAAARTR
jgi:hypothetical protein